MNYGVILLIIALIFAIIGKQTKVKNSFLIISTTLFLGFSYNMGGDWREYKIIYENLFSRLSFKELESIRFEKGYTFLNYIFKKIGINYEVFQAIILLVCIFIILKILEKKTKNFYVAYIYIYIQLLFPYSSEPILRQFIAVTIVIISFRYIEEKKILKYLLVIFLAVLFHKSAIIGIFFYFFRYFNFKSNKKIMLILIIAFILSLNIERILNFIINLLPFLREYSGYLISKKYSISVKRSILGSIYILIIKYIYFFIILFTKYDKKNIWYVNLAILGIIFEIYANNFLILVRFKSYFVFPIAVAISNIDNLKIKFKKYFITLMLLLQIFISYYSIISNETTKKKYYYYQNYLIEILKGKETESYYLRKKFMKSTTKEETLYD